MYVDICVHEFVFNLVAVPFMCVDSEVVYMRVCLCYDWQQELALNIEHNYVTRDFHSYANSKSLLYRLHGKAIRPHASCTRAGTLVV